MKKLNLEKYIDAVPDNDPKIRVDVNNGFNVYSYLHFDYRNKETAEALSALAAMDINVLRGELESRESAIKTLSSETEDIVKKWRVQEKARNLLEAAIKVIGTERPEHTDNKWVITTDEGLTKYQISNLVYRMDIHICQREKRSNNTSVTLPQWIVSWGINANRKNNWGSVIHGQEKRFSDMEQAEKYIEKIKTQYAYYFVCENPPIPRKYVNFFFVNGVLPPIFTMEPETVDLREAV